MKLKTRLYLHKYSVFILIYSHGVHMTLLEFCGEWRKFIFWIRVRKTVKGN